MNRQRGMTMVELLVSLAIVMVVIGAATTAYLKILRVYRTQGRLTESYMANLTGLEMLRYDIETAGFGLPTSLTAGVNYGEAAPQGANNPQPFYNPSDAQLNDSPSNPPRAFGHMDNGGRNGSDVLAIKSSAANLNPASKKWSTISRALISATPIVKMWGGTALDPVMDFAAGDRFIILSSDSLPTLMTDASNNWCFTFTGAAGPPTTGYYNDASALPVPPGNAQSIYYIYGLDAIAGAHRMPFNRVDYYLDSNPAFPIPSSCATGTFTLFRSTISQTNGTLTVTPLIDCVEDFQVAFGLATALDNNINSWVTTLGGMSAVNIQQQLREVRVFLLYSEGLGDTSRSPDFRSSGTPLTLGDPDTGVLSAFTPVGAQLQYRWKIIEMDAKPMNLIRP